MKNLYHATDLHNADSIDEHGLIARPTYASTRGDQYAGVGVWMFADTDLAEEYASDNFFDGYVIFEVEADDINLVPDAEYDTDESWICTHDVAPWALSRHTEYNPE